QALRPEVDLILRAVEPEPHGPDLVAWNFLTGEVVDPADNELLSHRPSVLRPMRCAGQGDPVALRLTVCRIPGRPPRQPSPADTITTKESGGPRNRDRVTPAPGSSFRPRASNRGICCSLGYASRAACAVSCGAVTGATTVRPPARYGL